MDCQDQPKRADGDGLERTAGERLFDLSATAWLVGEAVRHLNAADEEGTLAYGRVTELLGGRADAVKTVAQVLRRTPPSDVSLRWSLVHLLGDVADREAAEFLTRLAVEPLPAQERRQGCEGPNDGEVLVRTMAIEALQNVAARHPEAAEFLLKVVAERPARPLLIEAVKAAAQLGRQEEVRKLLPQEDHWMLEIRRARIEEIAAEPERQDVKERGFIPPKMPSGFTAPGAPCRVNPEC